MVPTALFKLLQLQYNILYTVVLFCILDLYIKYKKLYTKIKNKNESH